MNSNGSRVAIGAPNKSGRVQVYQYRTVTNDEWVEKNIVKGDDETLKTDKEYWIQLGSDINDPNDSGYSVIVMMEQLSQLEVRKRKM